jgi:hypothetical protein
MRQQYFKKKKLKRKNEPTQKINQISKESLEEGELSITEQPNNEVENIVDNKS